MRRILSALWTCLLVILKPSMFLDDSVTPENRIPDDVVRPGQYGHPGPQDNPFNPNRDWYHHMKWDQDHGWCDYS